MRTIAHQSPTTLWTRLLKVVLSNHNAVAVTVALCPVVLYGLCNILLRAATEYDRANYQRGIDAAIAKSDREVQSRLDRSAREPTPWLAYSALYGIENDFPEPGCKNYETGDNFCADRPIVKQALEKRMTYLTAAAASGDKFAQHELFEVVHYFNDGNIDAFPGEDAARTKVAPIMIDGLDNPDATRNMSLLLLSAGLLETGQYVHADHARAIRFYARAWRGGEPMSAGSISKIAENAGDLRTALLWNIRCTYPCQIEKPAYNLSAAEVDRIGKLARDQSLVFVPANNE
jgi:hypothetical protein